MRELLSRTGAYRMIKNQAAKGELSHAYLLVFPDERNLRFALKEFSKIILGADDRQKALIDRECFSDCSLFPEEGKRLSSDNANTLLTDCRIKPVEGDKRLFVLDKFHDANASVQNKLLKILEEPPEGVYFLLGATSEFSILPTVKSRVIKLEIPPFSEGEIARFLERNYPDKTGFSDFAAACGGVAGEAQNLVEGTYYGELLSLSLDFAEAEERDIPALSAKAASVKQKQEFLSVLRLVFRDILMYNLNREPLLKGCKERIKRISLQYSPSAAIAVLETLAKAEFDVKFNANFPMLTETTLMRVNKEKNKCRK